MVRVTKRRRQTEQPFPEGFMFSPWQKSVTTSTQPGPTEDPQFWSGDVVSKARAMKKALVVKATYTEELVANAIFMGLVSRGGSLPWRPGLVPQVAVPSSHVRFRTLLCDLVIRTGLGGTFPPIPDIATRLLAAKRGPFAPGARARRVGYWPPSVFSWLLVAPTFTINPAMSIPESEENLA